MNRIAIKEDKAIGSMGIMLLSTALDRSSVSFLLMRLAQFLQEKHQVHLVVQEHFDAWQLQYFRDRGFNIPVHSLHCPRWNILKARRILLELLQAHKPDILHCHLGRSYIIGFLCRKKVPRVIATFHNNKHYFSFLTRSFITLNMQKFNAVTAVSQSAMTTYLPYLTREIDQDTGIITHNNAAARSQPVQNQNSTSYSKLSVIIQHSKRKNYANSLARVIYNPVIVNTFSYSQKKVPTVVFPKKHIIIGVVNRFSEGKGYEYWYQLMHRLTVSPPPGVQVHFWAAGEGPLLQYYRRKARSLSPDAVQFLGHRSDVSALMRRSHLMLYPSQNEGFGLVPCEALALGVPVLVQNLAVFREILGNKSVWLVNFTQIDELRRKIADSIVQHRVLVNQAHEDGKKILQIFQAERIFHEYERLYCDCLSSSE